MAKNNVTIEIRSNTKQAAEGIKDIEEKLTGFGKSIDDTFGKFKNIATLGGTLTIAAAAIGKVAGEVRELVDAYKVQEQVERRLTNALRNKDSALYGSAQSYKDLASALQNVTTTGDEVTLGYISGMIEIGGITKEVIPEATEQILNLTAAGRSADQAFNALARALSNPKKGLEGLRELNVMLTQSQTEEILALESQNQHLEAQKAILNAVEGAYGGLATAVAQTDTGKLDQIANSWGDIKENLGALALVGMSSEIDNAEKLVNLAAEWTGNEKTAAQVTAARNSVIKKAFRGGDLAGISDEDLMDTMSFLRESFESTGMPGSHNAAEEWFLRNFTNNYREYAGAWEALSAESSRRAAIDSADAFYSSDGTKGKNLIDLGALGGSGSTPASTETLADFIKKYGAGSTTQQIANYDELIGKAQEWQKTLTEESDQYTILAEIIEDLTGKRDKLANPAEGPSEYDQILGKWGGLSATKQGTDIDAAIARVQTLKDTLAEGSTEAKILQEIMDSLASQKDALAGVDDIDAFLDTHILPVSQEQYIENLKAEISLGEKLLENLSAEDDRYEALAETIKGLKKERDEYLEGLETENSIVQKYGYLLSPKESQGDVYDRIAREATAEIGNLDPVTDKDTIDTLNQIVAAAQELKAAWDAAADASAEAAKKAESYAIAFKSIDFAQNVWNAGMEWFNFFSDYDGQIDAQQKALDEMSANYTKYFDNVNGYYATEQDKLTRWYTVGALTKEQFIEQSKALDEEEAEKKAAMQEEQEKAADKLDKLKEKQFQAQQANDAAQAAMSGARAMTGVLADTQGPLWLRASAATAIGLLAAGQIANIYKEQYTPMASGALVTGPKHALIGEAGPELVLPLNRNTLDMVGGGASSVSSINVIVNIEHAYGRDDVMRGVYDGISELQRNNILPPWEVA